MRSGRFSLPECCYKQSSRREFGRRLLESRQRLRNSGVCPYPASGTSSNGVLDSFTAPSLVIDQQWLFQLHPFCRALLADVALHQEHHVLFEDTVVAPLGEVDRVGHAGIFIGQATAVNHHHVAVVLELLGYRPAALGEFAIGQTRLDRIDAWRKSAGAREAATCAAKYPFPTRGQRGLGRSGPDSAACPIGDEVGRPFGGSR